MRVCVGIFCYLVVHQLIVKLINRLRHRVILGIAHESRAAECRFDLELLRTILFNTSLSQSATEVLVELLRLLVQLSEVILCIEGFLLLLIIIHPRVEQLSSIIRCNARCLMRVWNSKCEADVIGIHA